MKSSLLLLLLFSINAIGQQMRFTTETDTNRILIGEQIRLQIYAELPKGTDFTWPIFPDTIDGFEIVHASSTDTVTEKALWKITQNIRLTSFDSGYYAIPPLSLAYDGQTLLSQAIAIEVQFPEVQEETEYYDIKKPLEVERDWKLILLILFVILIIIGLIIFLIRYFRKENKRKFDAQKIKLSPAQYAHHQLDELEKEKLWEKGHLKAYYSRLIDILRFYLQRRYRISAMESTAEELIDQIRELKLGHTLFEEVRKMLLTGAMVKYAREKPGSAENEKAISTVRKFIDETRYVPTNNEESDA